MSDPKVYTQLLKLTDPWYISRIDVDVAGCRRRLPVAKAKALGCYEPTD